MEYAWLQFRGLIAQTLLEWALTAAPKCERKIYAECIRDLIIRLAVESPILHKGYREYRQAGD